MHDEAKARALVERDCKFFETWAADIRASCGHSADADTMDAMCARYRALLDVNARLRASLTVIERINYLEGKPDKWRAAKMAAVANSALDGTSLAWAERMFPRARAKGASQ